MSKLIPILCVLAAGGIFFGYINPTVTGSIAETNAAIERYDSALAAAKKFEQKQAQLAAEKQKIAPEALTRLESFLPDGVDNVQLILDLDALAARSGLRLGNFQTTESGRGHTAAGGPVGADGTPIMLNESSLPTDSVDLSMSASGSYASMRAFLAGVETSLRPLDLIEFSVSDSNTGVYNYQMTFRLYWLR